MGHKKSEAAKKSSRIEAFSDGVFAIAITLLVLELIGTLHPHSDAPLLNTFINHWQSFLAFLIGFITILICWINHHNALEYIRKIDTTFMWINGFLLFIVTLTPFPTAILADYLDKEGGTALAVFGLNYLMISIAAYGICSYAYNHHFIVARHREFYYAYKLMYRYAIIYNLIVLSISLVSITIPIILYAILFTFFAAPKAFASRIYKIRTAGKYNITEKAGK
jgi:uncharacterized membrane protein